MKKKVSLMLTVILILQIMLPMLTVIWKSGFTIKSVAADTLETTVDGIVWTYILDGENNAIDVKPKDRNSLPQEVTIPSTLDEHIVKSIGSSAFYGCSSLTSIEIPEGVTSINSYAFDYCTSLDNIIIPESTTIIGREVFRGCKGLVDIEIPSGVINIGQQAFRSCSNLESINVDENNKNYISENGVLFDKSKKEIICYPVGKRETEYMIPNSVTKIEICAFEGSSLESIIIPESVTVIGTWAFLDCANLESIIIPEKVTKIDGDVFDGCNSLTSINTNENNNSYSSENGILFNKDKTEIVRYPEGKTDTKYIIQEGITRIGGFAFYNCDSLKNITIPNSVISIGRYAFCECENLTSINIPKGITSIGFSAFSTCRNLEKIVIPESVTFIGQSAFSLCENLIIYCYSDSYAETYAKENNIQYEIIIKGDVNGDGKVDFKDILLINKHRLNKAQLTGIYLKAADVNGDSKVDFMDILKINKYRLGKISSL